MNEQGGENQEFLNKHEEVQGGGGFTQEQVDATLRRLEEVLAEDLPQPENLEGETRDADDATSFEDLKKGLGEGDIELISDEGTPDEEPYSDEFIEKAKKALEQMLSPDDNKDAEQS